MQFDTPLLTGTLIRRYKRFLADIELDNGKTITAHCPNTGSMLRCNEPGARVWVWDSKNDKRKYPITWELVEVDQKYKACINTARPNHLVKEAILNQVIPEFVGYQQLKTEKKYGQENSRIDLWLENKLGQECYIEVKNVTLLSSDQIGLGYFPDAVTSRGAKHLRELMHIAAMGHQAYLFFCVSHTGIEKVLPARHIDQEYADTLAQAVDHGVKVLAWQTEISDTDIRLAKPVDFELG